MQSDIVVVDVSLALKWPLVEQHSPEARRLLTRWAGDGRRVLAPSWFGCEAANALHQRTRTTDPAKRITFAEAHRALNDVLDSVELVTEDAALAVRALELASMYSQRQVYDCQYLALAERYDCECWTADRRFWDAANSSMPRLHRIEEA